MPSEQYCRSKNTAPVALTLRIQTTSMVSRLDAGFALEMVNSVFCALMSLNTMRSPPSETRSQNGSVPKHWVASGTRVPAIVAIAVSARNFIRTQPLLSATITRPQPLLTSMTSMFVAFGAKLPTIGDRALGSRRMFNTSLPATPTTR